GSERPARAQCGGNPGGDGRAVVGSVKPGECLAPIGQSRNQTALAAQPSAGRGGQGRHPSPGRRGSGARRGCPGAARTTTGPPSAPAPPPGSSTPLRKPPITAG